MCILDLNLKFNMTALAAGREEEWEQEAVGRRCRHPEGEGGKSVGPEYVLVPVVLVDWAAGRGDSSDLKQLCGGRRERRPSGERGDEGESHRKPQEGGGALRGAGGGGLHRGGWWVAVRSLGSSGPWTPESGAESLGSISL